MHPIILILICRDNYHHRYKIQYIVALEFLQGIGNAAVISVIYDCKEQVHYSDCNKIYPPKREFQKYIGRHGGINNVTIYPIDESDGYLECCKVYLKDGTFVTVAGLC